jgi:hypothetical protein
MGGWSAAPIVHTPIPAALFDMSGAYAWSHQIQGLMRFRIAEQVDVADVTEEVRSLANCSSLVGDLIVGNVPFPDRLILVRLVPTGQEYLPTKPVRSGDSRLVFAPTDLNGAANWWWLSDALAGLCFGGRFPINIIEAVEFVANGVRPGIRAVRLPGGRLLDPSVEDLGFIARAERAAVLGDQMLPEWKRTLLDGQLRLVGSTFAFGNTARLDRDTKRRAVAVSVIGPDGEYLGIETEHPETPGPHFDLLVSGAVTSRVRLAMASSIAAVEAAGGSWLHAATDSLLIATTVAEEAEFVPCNGGPHKHGRKSGVLALPLSQVQSIFERTGAPWRCHAGDDVPLTGYVSGVYRYALVDPIGDVSIASEAALGGVYADPTGTGARTSDRKHVWAVDANLAVARAGIARDGRGPLPELGLPECASLPAIRIGIASTPEQLARLEQAFPDRRVRPFTRFFSAVLDPLHSSAGVPITLDVDLSPDRWLEANWVDARTGEQIRLTIEEHPQLGQVRVRTYREVVELWRLPSDPTTEPVEAVDHILQPGLRRVLPVRSRAEMVQLIGKEGDDLMMLLTDPLAAKGDELTIYRQPDTWLPILEVARLLGAPDLAKRTGCSIRTLQRALVGKNVAPKTKAAIAAAVSDAASQLVERAPMTCARPGCDRRISLRRKWCSDRCRKIVERGHDKVDLHRRGGVRCPKCNTAWFGATDQPCPNCGGKGAIEVKSSSCPSCGTERTGDTESPCPVCMRRRAA